MFCLLVNLSYKVNSKRQQFNNAFCIDFIVWWVLHVDLILSQHNFQKRDYVPWVSFDMLSWKQSNLGNKKTTFILSAESAAKTFLETTALSL